MNSAPRLHISEEKKLKDQTPSIVHSHDISLDSDYIQWIADIKGRFRRAQIKAAVKVNSEQLLFNWQLGRDLVVRKAEEKWGKGVVEQISLDLQNEFPDVKGFSAHNLWYMKSWYVFLRMMTLSVIRQMQYTGIWMRNRKNCTSLVQKRINRIIVKNCTNLVQKLIFRLCSAMYRGVITSK